ncbi:MAG: hypothetical protein RL594_800 [Bacteroidota bacterium]|jgi:glycosyltransferase involved in cell wall biosynthesis
MNVGGSQEFIINYCREIPEFDITIMSIFGDNAYENVLHQLPNVRIVHLCNAKGTNRKKLMLFVPYAILRFAISTRHCLEQYDWINPRLPFAALLCWLFGISKHRNCHFNIDCDARQLTFYEKAVFKMCLPSFGSLSIARSLRGGFSFLSVDQRTIKHDPFFVTVRDSIDPIVYTEGTHLLFIARLVPQKGATEAIAIMRELERNSPGLFFLHIIGDGPERANIESTCKSFNLQNVVLHGYQGNLGDWIVNCHGVLKTAVGEPSNSVVREALLAGKRVYSTIEADSDISMVERGLVIPLERGQAFRSAQRIIATYRMDVENPEQAREFTRTARAEFSNTGVRDYYLNLTNET